jgi:nitrogen fixation NifU-like protein
MTDLSSQDLDEFVQKMQRVMIEEATSIYGRRVVDLWLKPRNRMALENPDGHARFTGPCGDTMEIFVRIHDDCLTQATFLTDGCGPTLASGSMVTDIACGQRVSEAMNIDEKAVLDALGGLPEESRHCAKLAADTLRMALEDYVTREDGEDPPG